MKRRWPWRRAAVPDALRQRVSVVTKDRILGWSWLPGGGWAVATPSALLIVRVDSSESSPVCLRWDDVLRARWVDGSLEVVGVAEGTTTNERYVLSIAEDGRLSEAVRTLVTASLVWSERIDDGPDRGGWAAARRNAAGEIVWTVSFDAGLDPSDATLRAWADAQVDDIRAATGL